MEEIIENIIENTQVDNDIIPVYNDSPIEHKVELLKAALSTFHCCSDDYINDFADELGSYEKDLANPVKVVVGEPVSAGLSTEAKAGLVIGGLTLAAGIGYGLYKWFKKRNDDSHENPSV